MRNRPVLLFVFLSLAACTRPKNISWLDEYPYRTNGTRFIKFLAERTVRIEAVSVANGSSTLISRGAGAIIGSNGVVLTADHVLGDRFTKLLVYRCGLNIGQNAISCGRAEEATVLSRDPSYDLALLKINKAVETPRFLLGNSGRLNRGDLLWRVGMDETGWAAGPLLARRSVRISDRMEILAPTRPGASGGPLVDAEGRLVGIVTSTLPERVAIGMIAYAVPINIARARILQRFSFLR